MRYQSIVDEAPGKHWVRAEDDASVAGREDGEIQVFCGNDEIAGNSGETSEKAETTSTNENMILTTLNVEGEKTVANI